MSLSFLERMAIGKAGVPRESIGGGGKVYATSREYYRERGIGEHDPELEAELRRRSEAIDATEAAIFAARGRDWDDRWEQALTEPTPNVRAAAVAMLRDGIATPSEVARLAGVSRQLVRYWAQQAEIETAQSRAKALQTAWQKACNIS